MIKAIDLFSGPGGLTIGMKRSGISPIASVERRKDAVDTYFTHTPDATHYNEDIRGVNFTKYKGRVDLVYGGPPCQPFSTGGLRLGEFDKRDMFPEYLRAVYEIQPEAFLIENVPGLASRRNTPYYHFILQSLRDLGFVVSSRVLLAADFGVPQKRRRLFIIGMRKREFHFPVQTHGEHGYLAHVPTSKVVSKADALGEPPDCPVKYAKFPDVRKSPYAGQLYNGGGRPINMDAPCHTILASAGGYKTHWVDTLDVAPAYTAHLLKGGKPREGYVPGARRLSIEESALIQTFPKDMKFRGSRSSQFTQVGDAVPPQLAEKLGNALVHQMNGGSLSIDETYNRSYGLPLFEGVFA